eukprot:9307924-Heterocapsa_arctica.AAC.1
MEVILYSRGRGGRWPSREVGNRCCTCGRGEGSDVQPRWSGSGGWLMQRWRRGRVQAGQYQCGGCSSE